MKSVYLAGVFVVLFSVPFLSIAQEQGRLEARAEGQEVPSVARAGHSEQDRDRGGSANRVNIGLSDNETSLTLPWFLDELLQTINTGDSVKNSLRDYVQRLPRDI